MNLQEGVRDAFASGGALASATKQFMPRDGQTQMAQAVAGTIQEGGALVVEAGTGVGKTFAYLVPALLSGERILLSTATKTLQDQLYGRDLPRVVKALGVPVRMALLKGRSSYLCLHRLTLARTVVHLRDGADLAALARVERWAMHTSSGDLSEMADLDERSPLIPLVTSTRENCLGTECPKFRACHVNLARRDALAADVVVINHHLFFADLLVRESGVAELLPTVRVVVFDEAHQLNEIGVQFLGLQLSTAQLRDFARDLLAAGLRLARGFADWQGLASQLERALQDLRFCLGQTGPAGTRLRWTDHAPAGLGLASWQKPLSSLSIALAHCIQALDILSELALDFVRLHERAAELARRVALFNAPCEPGAVRWIELGLGAQARLVQSPLDISEAVQSRVWKHREDGSMHQAWIFTSATLGSDAELRWFTEPCGLTQATVLKIGSPFDYPRQSSLYVPRQLVKPGDPGHGAQVAGLAAQAARRLGGRTLLLTTTLRALVTIGAALQTELSGSGMAILVQGELPKHILLERFRQPGVSGAILVASASFWEGVDVPGEALQLVVIDKLPFPPPNDPIVEARSRRLERAGRSPFSDYSIPEASVALRQGAGRLIRSDSDRGILVVCDTRLASMGYGRRLLASLPAMRRLQNEAEFQEALEELTRTSTTAVQQT